MAKLSAHGAEIGRIHYTTKTVAYMSDGKVLQNYGSGWKLRGKLKDGVIPAEAYQRAVTKQREYIATHPSVAAYREALHSMACSSKRAKLHTCVALMPDDCDGVWSEACDGYGENISASVDEVAELCRLYKAAFESTSIALEA